MIEDVERRHVPRYIVRFPLRFLPTQREKMPYCFGEMLNISPHGVCFLTRTALAAGETVSVFLKVPSEVIGTPSPEWRWTGKVVRIRPAGSAPEVVETGVSFIAFEPSDGT